MAVPQSYQATQVADEDRGEVVNYIIYRGSWRRGGDTQVLSRDLGDTTLYHATNEDDVLLGPVLLLKAGGSLHRRDLEDVGEPDGVPDSEPALVACGLLNDNEDYGRQSAFSKEAMPINDNEAITDQQREEMLIKLGARYGHTIAFVDETAPWFAE